MDAGRLDALSAETFAGVVDKGTIDAVLSGGLEPARRICREAMRVLEPGGTFLVISNTPAEKLRDPLVVMCGPGSTAGSPSITVPAAGDACVYAHLIRKTNSSGDQRAAGVSSSVPEQEAGRAEPPERSNGSGASTAGAAPGDDSRVSELEPPVEPSRGDGGCEGRPPREGRARGGLPLPEASQQQGSSSGNDSAKKGEDGGPEETERRDREAGSQCGPREQKSLKYVNEEIERLERAVAEAQARRAPPDDGETPPPLEPNVDPLKLPELLSNMGRQPSGAPVPSVLPPQELLEALGPLKSNPEIDKALIQARLARESAAGVGSEAPPVTASSRRPREQGQQQQQQQQASQPGVPEQQSSLPWGSQESFFEDEAGITYELKFDTELSSSNLSVEIGTSRIKASYRRQPGDCEVLLDRELHDKVTAESTWCLEDKTLLTFM